MVRRSMRQHALSTTVTIAAVALAAGLVMSVFSIKDQARNAFTGGTMGFDAVLGARGSPLQLVLNAVFHLETSPGNIPWSLYEEVKRDPRVALAVPYALGDNYYGFRLVGTTEKIFTDFEYRKGHRFEVEPGGRIFDPTRREAVVGSYVARRTGLRVGSTFQPFHGLFFDPGTRHDEEFTVVGVLKPTNSPSDRVIWIPIEGVYRMEGHVLRGAGEPYTPTPDEEIPDEHKEVSAVMLKLRSPAAGMALSQTVNRQGTVATLAWPVAQVMADLFERLGWAHRILALVAYLVVVVAAGTILASITNTINERRREFAIMRALGARRRTVFAIIVAESAAIAAAGSVAGYIVYFAIVATASVIVRAQTGVVLDVFAWHPVLAAAPAGMTLLGALAGVLPAVKAYATDVATNLAPAS
jgi:putative ABC transport system permease protein